jgi:hypothetical protein
MVSRNLGCCLNKREFGNNGMLAAFSYITGSTLIKYLFQCFDDSFCN